METISKPRRDASDRKGLRAAIGIRSPNGWCEIDGCQIGEAASNINCDTYGHQAISFRTLQAAEKLSNRRSLQFSRALERRYVNCCKSARF